MNLDKAKDLMTDTRLSFIADKRVSFFAGIFLRCEFHWVTDIPTAATSGKDIYFNPEFFSNLSKQERIFLLFHETGHIVLDHISRRGDYDPKLWNIAADYKVNQMAREIGLTIIDGAYLDHQYDEMSTEQVYKELESKYKNKNIPDVNDCIYSKQDLNTDPEESERLIKDMILESYHTTSLQGGLETIPNSIREAVLKIQNPEIPWHQILRNSVVRIGYDDYSYENRDRRYDDIYLPTLQSEHHESPNVYIDCSCSVSEEEYYKQIAQTASIFKTISPDQVNIIHFDTQIINTEVVKNIRDMSKMKFVSGGGTDISPVIDHIKKHKPKVAVIFTDGGFRFKGESNKRPKTPVFWVIINNPHFKAPYGKVIHIKDL